MEPARTVAKSRGPVIEVKPSIVVAYVQNEDETYRYYEEVAVPGMEPNDARLLLNGAVHGAHEAEAGRKLAHEYAEIYGRKP